MRNYMIYGKLKGEKRFGAMDVQHGNIGVGQLYASLYPTKELAIERVNSIIGFCKEGTILQVRPACSSTVCF